MSTIAPRLPRWQSANPCAAPRSEHAFNHSRCAALSDLERPEWRQLFARLEQEQADFLRHESEFRSREYKWPRDALHWWSRLWEYPYTFFHLQNCIGDALHAAPPRVVDVGSGVTFFPFSVARLGCHVTCLDIDPVAGADLARAVPVVDHAPGAVDFRLSQPGRLPLDDEEADAVYCVSVLEHVDDIPCLVGEMARILKPGGSLVLTIDLDLRGNADIGPARYRDLLAALDAHFDHAAPGGTVHPADLLLSSRGPHPLKPFPQWRKPWFYAKQWVVKPLLGRKPARLTNLLLAVQGLSLVRR